LRRAGRYNNVGEVVRSGLRLLQEAEARRQAFMTMLRGVEDETEREGSVAVDDMLTGIDRIIPQLVNRGPSGSRPTTSYCSVLGTSRSHNI